jgi:hypothetical protein
MRKKECADIWRGFIDAFDEGMKNIEYGLCLVSRKQEMAQFLEHDIDLLNAEERYRVYRHIGGFFPEQLPRILAARLRNEKNAKCLNALKRIAAIPRDEVSKTKTAKFCRELFHAQQLLRRYDADREEAEQEERIREFGNMARANRIEDFDRVDMLVFFSLVREPKDRELFFKAIAGLTDEQIVSRKGIKTRVFEALLLFGHGDRVRHLKDLSS